ncbi:hypothetical protein, partial [Bifidobacterium sp. UTBIF-56]|uniref:hypothetical protein n=1 Tax=Bifidobacterium sp. UTBIF-56 TaxID=1465261 RepID=UPI001C614DFD
QTDPETNHQEETRTAQRQRVDNLHEHKNKRKPACENHARTVETTAFPRRVENNVFDPRHRQYTAANNRKPPNNHSPPACSPTIHPHANPRATTTIVSHSRQSTDARAKHGRIVAAQTTKKAATGENRLPPRDGQMT